MLPVWGERPIRRTLIAALVVLNVGNLLTIADGPPAKWLLLSKESNPSTWWNSLLYLFVGLLLLAEGERAAEPRGWRAAAVVACFLSLDEVALIHESYDALPGGHLLAFGWVVPGIVIAVLVCMPLYGWYRSLDRGLRRSLTIAGFVVLLGAVGVETIAGDYQRRHSYSRGYEAISTVEENLELIGGSLAVLSLFRWVSRPREASQY